MTKLIYFDDKNDLVRNFCSSDSKFISKIDFAKNIEDFKDSIAVCYGPSNYGEAISSKKNGINFIYIDNCYFGSLNSGLTKRKPKKIFYRVVYNDFVLHEIVPRSNNRLESQLRFLKKEYKIRNFIRPNKTNGYNIVIIPPSGKILDLCNINVETWLDEIKCIVKMQTDLNITVKERPRSRFNRFVLSNIYDYLQDSNSVITFSSMAAVEAVIYGVPSFIYNKTLLPTIFKENIRIHSAAEPVSILNIKNIKNRYFPENRIEWLSSLSYGQFSREEINDGTAKRMILEEIK
jgi:hypothetical protein